MTVRWPVLIASPGPATKVAQAVSASGAITIEVWMKPARADQMGPARIVTLSQDTVQRNFTLGQQADSYQVRLRTTETDANGLPGLASPGPESRRVQATRDAEGSYAMVYVPKANQTVTVDTSKLSTSRLRAWWYDPRTGRAEEIAGEFPVGGPLSFTTPPEGPDWVLVLDDAARGYPAPGRPLTP